jgi:hypothetical protein
VIALFLSFLTVLFDGPLLADGGHVEAAFQCAFLKRNSLTNITFNFVQPRGVRFFSNAHAYFLYLLLHVGRQRPRRPTRPLAPPI